MRVITSFSRKGYDEYGSRMGVEHWPVPITVYSEDDLPIPHKKLNDPDHLRFLSGPKDEGGDYRFHAKRFSYKVFSILEASKEGGLLIWLDGDTRAFRGIPLEFLRGLLPKGKHIAYLGRERMHSECGFVIYDCDKLGKFFEAWRNLYVSGELYSLKEWHDSFVFDHLREKMKIPSENISGVGKNAHHPFINSPLGKYIDHMKGNRKARGRSSKSDLVWKRPEGYWNAL
jgi:hypothetical protein